jgi:16S rRNA (guanine966-N2)-methyltransferase
MRIVGGTLSGRRFPGPPGDRTRPTSERVREALASALDARDAIEGATVLDLFAGTGALAFEALSRGAARAVLVDRDRAVLAALRDSARRLGLTDRVTVLSLDLSRRLTPGRIRGPFDLVFVDPPYAKMAWVGPRLSELRGELADGAWVVIEHAKRHPPTELPAFLSDGTTKSYGDTCIRMTTVETS